MYLGVKHLQCGILTLQLLPTSTCVSIPCHFCLTLWGRKATIVALKLKMCFEAIHSIRYIFPCEYYLNTFYYPKCFLLQIYLSVIQVNRLVHNTLMDLWQKTVQNKKFTVEESPFSDEQFGKIHFCVEYFIYEIHGIKCMPVQKTL